MRGFAKGWIGAALLGILLVCGAGAEERLVPLGDLGYRDGLVLEGPRGEGFLFFPVPRGQVLPGSRVDLALEVPPGLAPDSVVLLDLEGRPPWSGASEGSPVSCGSACPWTLCGTGSPGCPCGCAPGSTAPTTSARTCSEGT